MNSISDIEKCKETTSIHKLEGYTYYPAPHIHSEIKTLHTTESHNKPKLFRFLFI